VWQDPHQYYSSIYCTRNNTTQLNMKFTLGRNRLLSRRILKLYLKNHITKHGDEPFTSRVTTADTCVQYKNNTNTTITITGHRTNSHKQVKLQVVKKLNSSINRSTVRIPCCAAKMLLTYSQWLATCMISFQQIYDMSIIQQNNQKHT